MGMEQKGDEAPLFYSGMDSYGSENTMDDRMRRGVEFAEMLWFSFAQRIFRMAAELYGWDQKRQTALEEVYLRPNDYLVEVIVQA